MKEEEIRSTFDRIKELRHKADQKEKQLIKHLEEDGLLSRADAILLSSRIVSFGGRDDGTALEALVLASVSRKQSIEKEQDVKDERR